MPPRILMPEDFPERQKTLSISKLSALYNVDPSTIKRWRKAVASGSVDDYNRTVRAVKEFHASQAEIDICLNCKRKTCSGTCEKF